MGYLTISHQAEAITADDAEVLLISHIRMPRIPVNLLWDIVFTIAVSDGGSEFVSDGLYSKNAADCDPNCLCQPMSSNGNIWNRSLVLICIGTEGTSVFLICLKDEVWARTHRKSADDSPTDSVWQSIQFPRHFLDAQDRKSFWFCFEEFKR
jgi:hypothetical protein